MAQEVTKIFDGRLLDGTTLYSDAHPSYTSFEKKILCSTTKYSLPKIMCVKSIKEYIYKQ